MICIYAKKNGHDTLDANKDNELLKLLIEDVALSFSDLRSYVSIETEHEHK
jgi:hypothetical protein